MYKSKPVPPFKSKKREENPNPYQTHEKRSGTRYFQNPTLQNIPSLRSAKRAKNGRDIKISLPFNEPNRNSPQRAPAKFSTKNRGANRPESFSSEYKESVGKGKTVLNTAVWESNEVPKDSYSLFCWCGKEFTNPSIAFSHCFEVHKYGKFSLMHRTLAQLLSTDHSEGSKPEQQNKPIPQQHNFAVPKTIKRAVSTDKRYVSTHKEPSKPAQKTIIQKPNSKNSPKFFYDEKKKDNRNGKFFVDDIFKISDLTDPIENVNRIEDTFQNNRSYSSEVYGVWLYDPKDTTRYVFLEENSENWKENIRILRDNKWEWGKGPVGEKYPQKAICHLPQDLKSSRERTDSAIYSKNESRDYSPKSIRRGNYSEKNFGQKSSNRGKNNLTNYACPWCHVKGKWDYIKSHIRASGHLRGGALCICKHLCIEKECMIEHFTNSKSGLHNVYKGNLYSSTEFLVDRPYQEVIDLYDRDYKIVRLEPDVFKIEKLQ